MPVQPIQGTPVKGVAYGITVISPSCLVRQWCFILIVHCSPVWCCKSLPTEVNTLNKNKHVYKGSESVNRYRLLPIVIDVNRYRLLSLVIQFRTNYNPYAWRTIVYGDYYNVYIGTQAERKKSIVAIYSTVIQYSYTIQLYNKVLL